jgi:hypothetical protein
MNEQDKAFYYKILCVPLLFIAVGLTALLVARYYSYKKLRESMPPAQYAEMLRFFDEPYNFPAEWAEVKPHSPDFEAAIRHFQEEVTKTGVNLELSDLSFPTIRRDDNASGSSQSFREDYLYILQRGAELTPAEWAAAEEKIAEVADYLVAWSTFSRHPEYEMEAIPPKNPSRKSLPLYNPVEVSRAAGFLCLQSHVLAKMAKWPESLDSALSALRIARRHPASPIITHLTAAACEKFSYRSIARLASQCPKRGPLEEALLELNRFDDNHHSNTVEDEVRANLIGDLRWINREEIPPLHFGPGKPGVFYRRLVLQTERRKGFQQSQPFGSGTFLSRFLSAEVRDYLDFCSVILSAQSRSKAARGEFDLVRLILANRIRELGGETKTSELTDLVPKWLPEIPNDPFADKPYLWDAAHETFYGIGPDGKDDQNLLRYDPGNGTTSSGDIGFVINYLDLKGKPGP